VSVSVGARDVSDDMTSRRLVSQYL
jgi:hypothetical protein